MVLRLLLSLTIAEAALCPDGSAGLTRALYESGNVSAFDEVTCVPLDEFMDYQGDVVLKG